MTENKKMIIWILIPLFYGITSNTFMLMVSPILSQIVFAIFWFWVGIKFSSLRGSNFKYFMFGNSIWLLSFLLYLWQFVLMNDESRNMFIAIISQYYMLSFIWSGVKLSSLFSDVYYGTTITIIAYLSMLFVFIVGYTVGKLKAN
ncbi:hypothetical protein [Bacillus solimangrovi]|uniref:Uncharacterized protein n=1 Tax=Bacillus solimangrovi TaxID=1305675 RepID=A0A1E5LAL4_9BACI|nr:hypothetical protein [Bacillus solimangrovi]OEH91103.1 hypothetical protein BFG57_06955 [Bacillus solimangrovi]